MPKKQHPVMFSIIMTVFDTFHLLPRALNAVARQENTDWELLLYVDGPARPPRFSPYRVAHQFHRHFRKHRIEIRELARAEGCYGNVARNTGLDHAEGKYVCWVNHDNLISATFLSAHSKNIEQRPGCVSVVDIDLWKADRYFGRYPRRFAVNNIDLLCYALPLEIAKGVNAFGGEMSRVYAADWLTFDAARKLAPVVHNRTIVGAHF